ncbi:MAG: hypothetical protein KA313_08900 [Pseudarcicella sp.]|jgi:hypothetical protein|nr:hypothetical protein [Pseudarcicella sp.]MBP6411202.1 hypothetical protein [Pseudarcicella sp.]
MFSTSDLKALLSNKKYNEVTLWVNEDAIKFSEIIKLFLIDDFRLNQACAHVILMCLSKKPDSLNPHIMLLLEYIDSPTASTHHKRNILRIMQEIDLPIICHDLLAKLSFDLLQNRQESIAVKVFAMWLIYRLGTFYPDILPELKFILTQEIHYQSAAYKNRAYKILKHI